MDSPTTTKADRLYALNLTGHTHELYVQWAETGASLMASEYPTSSFADVIARMEIMAAAHAAGYARATADAKAFLAAKELAAHQAQMREAEASLYDARLRIGCDEHVGASEKERG